MYTFSLFLYLFEEVEHAAGGAQDEGDREEESQPDQVPVVPQVGGVLPRRGAPAENVKVRKST